jgi:spoIIIJ-associated protein
MDWEKAADTLEEFLNTVLDATGLELDAEIDVCDPEKPVDIEAPNIVVDLAGPDARLLLEDRNELLRSLEYLAHRWVRLESSHAALIRFDSNGFRADRINELGLLASTAADQVRETGRPFRFQPMNARERRVIHMTLREAEGVRSASEGEGFDRVVVIHPA